MAFRKLGTILADLMSEPEKLQAAANNAPRNLTLKASAGSSESLEGAPDLPTQRRNGGEGIAPRATGMEKSPTTEGRAKVARQKGGPDDFGALIAVKTKTTRRRPRANSALKGLSPAVPALGLRLVAVDGKLVHAANHSASMRPATVRPMYSE